MEELIPTLVTSAEFHLDTPTICEAVCLFFRELSVFPDGRLALIEHKVASKLLSWVRDFPHSSIISTHVCSVLANAADADEEGGRLPLNSALEQVDVIRQVLEEKNIESLVQASKALESILGNAGPLPDELKYSRITTNEEITNPAESSKCCGDPASGEGGCKSYGVRVQATESLLKALEVTPSVTPDALVEASHAIESMSRACPQCRESSKEHVEATLTKVFKCIELVPTPALVSLSFFNTIT